MAFGFISRLTVKQIPVLTALLPFILALSGTCLAQPATETGLLLEPAEATGEKVILTLVFFAVALAMPLCQFITASRETRYTALGSASLAAGTYAMSASGLGAFLFGFSIAWEYISLAALLFLPYSLYSIVLRMFPGTSRHYGLSLGQKIHLLFAAAGFIGAASRLVSVALVLELFFFLAAISFMITALVLMSMIRNGQRAAESILLGLIGFLGLSLADPVSAAIHVSPPLHWPALWGLVALFTAVIASWHPRLRTFATPSPVPPHDRKGQDSPAIAAESLSPEAGKPQLSHFRHEISAPLGTGLLTATHLQKEIGKLHDLFRSGELKKSDMEKHLQSYQEAADALTANLQTAIDLVHTLKQQAPSRQEFNLDTHLRRAVAALKPRITEAGHQLHYSCPPDITILSHPLALTQILTNLVMNSLAHAYSPGDHGNLSVTASAHAGILQLRYTDDGKGIDGRILDKIFDPHFTTNAAAGHSGLGLSVVRSLATELGGTAECRSWPEQGTEFLIKIPMERR